MLSAIRIGDLDVLKRLIREGVKTNGTAECGCTPLVLSCFYGHWTLCHSLVENGADLQGHTCDSKSTAGYGAVHYAARSGKDELLSILLKQNVPLSHGDPEPFHLAAENGHVNCLKLLLEHESSTSHPRRLLDISRDGDQATATHLASFNGSTPALSFLINEGANTEAVDTYGRTPLHRAVSSCHIGAVKLLIAEGADVHCRDKVGQTPMHYTARDGFLDILLLLHQSDITARDEYGEQPIHLAAMGSHISVVQHFIDLGVNLHSSDLFEESPLHLMVAYGSQEMQEIAMKHVTDPYTSRHPRRGNILNIACFYGKLFTVKALLKRFPNENAAQFVDYPSRSGTPLYSAALRGDLEMMEALIEAGASLDLIGGEHGPPLHVACAMGRVEAVQFLLDRGAKMDYVGEDGKVIHAKDAAVHQKHVQALLKSWRKADS